MIHGIIDIGSNTVRMALYDIEGEKIDFLTKKKHLVGLAAYLENNVMTQAGIDKVCDVLLDFKSYLEIFNVSNVTAFTTAALRNCDNSAEAVAEIIRRTGIEVEIISGEREAEYDFIAATRNMEERNGVLADIGGASTELVYFADKKIVSKISLPMGSLAFRKKYCSSALPNKAEVKMMEERAAQIVADVPHFASLRCENLVAIGGTFKGSAALHHAMFGGDDKNIIKAQNLSAMIKHFSQLEKMDRENAILLLKNIPDRVNTIVAGMVLADVLARHFACEQITYSDSGVREGFIYTHLLG